MLGQTLCKCKYEIVMTRKHEGMTGGRMNNLFIELRRSTEEGRKKKIRANNRSYPH